MPIIPNIPKQVPKFNITCIRCGETKSENLFAKTHSSLYLDGRFHICNNCATAYLTEHDFDWAYVDKLCQCADIPFIVREWDRILDMSGRDTVWENYCRAFASVEYENLGWDDYHRQYKALKEKGFIEDNIPYLDDAKMKELRLKWGENYDDSDLYYLEDLYKGLLASQNVSGALQKDQAKKLCKLSLEIDTRIREGDKDVDKFLSSYDKLVKTAEFTPKNTRNAADFDSFAELALWLEKHGEINKFYDNTTRDIIDETIKSIQTYNQRLYINEGGIGDAITERLRLLQQIDKNEKSLYETDFKFDEMEYDNDGYTLEDTEEFDAMEDDVNGGY